MITIFGNVPSSDATLIEQLKDYFEVDQVMLDWDGEQKEPFDKTTLAITTKAPPYQAECKVLTLNAAQSLLASC